MQDTYRVFKDHKYFDLHIKKNTISNDTVSFYQDGWSNISIDFQSVFPTLPLAMGVWKPKWFNGFFYLISPRYTNTSFKQCPGNRTKLIRSFGTLDSFGLPFKQCSSGICSYKTQKETTQTRGNVAKHVSSSFGWILLAGFYMLWKIYAVITLQLLLSAAVLPESGPV